MKPWHLCSEAERDRVLTCLDVEADWQIHHYQAHNRDYSDALRAAAAMLRDAAPWPDEALVVEWDSRIWEVIDAHGDGVLELRSESASSFSYYRYCLPLTPAAAEFLAAMRDEQEKDLTAGPK